MTKDLLLRLSGEITEKGAEILADELGISLSEVRIDFTFRKNKMYDEAYKAGYEEGIADAERT